jgi:hypothetical protein
VWPGCYRENTGTAVGLVADPWLLQSPSLHISNYAEFLAGKRFQQKKGRKGGIKMPSRSSFLLLIAEPGSTTRFGMFWGLCQATLQEPWRDVPGAQLFAAVRRIRPAAI